MKEFKIEDMARGLSLGEDGIWFSKAAASVSYPEEGSEWCQQIEEDSFWFRHRNNCILAAMSQFTPAGPVIDIGGGNGFVALALKGAGYGTILLEPGLAGARHASRRGLTPVICSSIEDAGFSVNSFHAVGLFDVLEHCADDVHFLNKVRGLLVKGGLLYLTVPAYGFLWSADDDFAQHFRRYTLAEVASRLQKCGFLVEYGSYFFMFLPVPIFFLRTLPSILALRKKSELEQERNAHRSPRGVLGRLLDRLLRSEVNIIGRGMEVPFGGSCLVVARAI